MTHIDADLDDDDLQPEYDFSEAVQGKHHLAYRKGTEIVRLDLDQAPASDQAQPNSA